MSLDACIAKALKGRRITTGQAKRIKEIVRDPENAEKFLESFIQKQDEFRRVYERQVLAVKRATAEVLSHPDGAGRGIESLLARDTRERAGGISNVDFRTRAIYDKARAETVDAYGALAVRRLGLVTDDDLAKRVGRGLFGERVDFEAKRLADEISRGMETLRLRANVAGMTIAKRKDFGLPQTHDLRRIAETPKDEWVDFTLPKVKRIYSEEAPEGVLNEEFTRKFLETMHDEAVVGAARLESGTAGNIRLESESRRIIFNNFDDWLGYSQRFGHGEKSVLSMVDGHFRDMARTIAQLEVLGPRPRETLEQLMEVAAKKRQLSAWQRGRIERLFSVVSGEVDGVRSQWLANTGAFVRSWLVSAQLGSAIVSSFNDTVTGAFARRLNGMPLTRALDDAFRGMSRAQAARLGIAADSSLLQLQANRFGDFAGAASGAGRLADFTLRASGLTAWTESGRRAFGVEWLGFIGDFVQSQTRSAALPQAVGRQLSKYGIKPEHWDNIVLRTKTIEKEGAHFLDLDGFSGLARGLGIPGPFREAAEVIEAEMKLRGRRPKAVEVRLREQHGKAVEIQRRIQEIRDTENRLREMLAAESEFAMISGLDARTRAISTWGAERGTLIGEIARMGSLYKSFPLSMLFYHLGRGLNMPTTGGKLGYLGSFIAASTVVGAVSLQSKEILKGRDPRGMDNGQFWIEALGQGGALSVFEAMLEADSGFERVGRQLAGPVPALLEQTFNLTAGNVVQALQGKETKAGRETAKFIERYAPGSNLWYSRLIVQRYVWNNLERLLNDDFEADARRAARWSKNWGFGDAWWRPGELTPQRGPELGAVTGE
jgi:hypothetical protein